MEKNDIKKFKKEYEDFNEILEMNIDLDNNIVYKDIDEAIYILTNTTGIVYFGFPMCPWCRNAAPVLLEVAKTNNMVVNYVDVMQLEGPDYKKIVPVISQYLKEENGKKILYSPDIYFVKDGAILGHHLSTVTSQENPRINLNEEQKEELMNIYQELINKIK